MLRILRLPSEKWEITGIEVNTGDLPGISEDAEYTIETDTEEIRTLSLGEVVFHVSYRHGLRHECKTCGRAMKINKWVSNTFTNAPVFGMSSKVEVSVPQTHCPECGGYPQPRCPLVVYNHSYTVLTKFDVIRTLTSQTMTDTSDSCKVGKYIVSDVLTTTVEEGKAKQDLSGVRIIFCDEIQSSHGQEYVTMIADQDHRCISGVIGHTIESVEEATAQMVSHGLDPKKIEFFSADMSQAYKTGAAKCFPKAKLILDRFHVLKGCGDAVDKVRKRLIRTTKNETGECPEYLKRVKYTVLYRVKNQSDTHRDRMRELRMHCGELTLAFDLKEEIYDIFEHTEDSRTARSRIFSWYNRVRGSKIPEMTDYSEKILIRLNEILRCFDHKISNGVAEGMNNVYKKIKSAAYGFRKPENLINMCLFRMGRLKILI